MGVALIFVATAAGIQRRMNLGNYPADKIATQRVVMWLFLLTGIAFFVAALVRSLTY